MAKLQNILTVVGNRQLSGRFYCLSFDAPDICRHVQPGQFVHIRTNDGLEPFFRRPFSVYRAKTTLDVFFEPIGPGTRLMTQMKNGDQIDLLGPVGTPFQLPSKDIKHVVMIAGGIGVAPFLILSDALKDMPVDITLLYGGRTKEHTFDMADFKANGCRIHVATDDGSVGTKGRVDTLFPKITSKPAETFLYTCGPNPMMASVQAFAKNQGIRGQAACEEVMACALGACLGCSIRTTEGYKTVCYDGPCFDLDTVMFEAH